MMASGTRKENILIVNFEDPRFKKFDLDLLNQIYEIYLTELSPDEKHYVILDEVQLIDGWEKFARFLHENKKVNVFVTGSSSKLLSSEYSTVLSGRHIDIRVKPLSFREFLRFQGVSIASNLDISEKRHTIKREFDKYLKWGGFPKPTLVNEESEKTEILGTYFRDIVVKDIVMRYSVKDISKIEDLAKYYLTNISTLQSFNRIKNFMKLNLDTVERYSGYLSQAYLVSFVRKFSYSKKEQIVNPRKVYCQDNGIRNAVSFVFSKDLGRLAENIVFNRLESKNFEVYYWSNLSECDFIVKEKDIVKGVIQVCWNMENGETKDREIGGLLEACESFNLKSGLVLTEDYSSSEKVNGIKITYIPIWRWLLEE
jgi:hypothetical protein